MLVQSASLVVAVALGVVIVASLEAWWLGAVALAFILLEVADQLLLRRLGLGNWLFRRDEVFSRQESKEHADRKGDAVARICDQDGAQLHSGKDNARNEGKKDDQDQISKTSELHPSKRTPRAVLTTSGVQLGLPGNGRAC